MRSTTRASRAWAPCACSWPTRATPTTSRRCQRRSRRCSRASAGRSTGCATSSPSSAPRRSTTSASKPRCRHSPRRAQAIDGLDVQIEIDLGPVPGATGDEGSAAAEPGGRRLDAELESTIYRIVQEALTNVSRHARGDERGRQHLRARRRRPRVGDRRRQGSPGCRAARAARRWPRGGIRDGRHARACGARGRRARARAGARAAARSCSLAVPLAGRPAATADAGRARGRRPGRLAALVAQTQAPHVGGDLCARGEPELLDRARTVGLDGSLGDLQLLGDLGIGVAGGDQPDHLTLAI